MKGRIYGEILLTRGQNRIKTEDGSIELILLDGLVSPMDLTAYGGGIRLHVPENYAADVQFKSRKQQVIISLPAEIENNMAFINEGGPLHRLTATDAISILQSQNSQHGTADSTPGSPGTPSLAGEKEGADTFVDFVQVVPHTSQSPIIDGNLSEKAWGTAAAMLPFQSADSNESPQNLTEVFLMWDAENLYIGAKAYVSDSRIPRISQTQRDSPIWQDEAIEILLDPNPQTAPYYHFVINPIGAFFDQRVISPGAPNFRFAPADVKRDRFASRVESAETQQFVADSDWNSDANIATQINATFWSFEAAFPRSTLEKDAKNTWFFNVHRKAHANSLDVELHNSTPYREYSAWLPTYDMEHPWWPHWEGTLGELTLRAAQAPTSDTFETIEKLAVAAIKIEGNTLIPTEVVLKHLPIAPGDTVTNAQLAWLIAELESHDWFQEVRLETTVVTPDTVGQVEQPSKEAAKVGAISRLRPEQPLKVDLHIRVTESAVKFARKIDIAGNSGFPTLFIKRWFDLAPGYIALANAKLKQQMIADFYVNRGYTFATVTHLFENDTLQFTINEGVLDEIRFTGNRRIPRSELLAALDLNLEDAYSHTLGHSKIELMRKKLSRGKEQFKSIRAWRVQREGGKNILIVDIVEHPFAKYSGLPIVGFNRVHGLLLGGAGMLTTQLINEEQIFGSVSYGFSGKLWNYHAGLEKRFLKRYPFKFGAGFYKLTDTSYNNYSSTTLASLSDAIYGTAYENYYQRAGYQTWIAQAYGTSAHLRFTFTHENHENLFKSTDWSYLSRKQIKPGNPRINRGLMRMLSISWTFDTRDQKATLQRLQNMGSHMVPWSNERTRRGWRGYLRFQTAGQRLGSDFAFNTYGFEIARYTPLFKGHTLNVRLAGDFSDAPLPRQHLLYLGGASTLRGYPFNTFAGDNRILLNIEYRFIEETHVKHTTPNLHIGWTLSCFLDTGQVWWVNETPYMDAFISDLKTSIGIGFSFFMVPDGKQEPWSVGLEIAEPLSPTLSLRNPMLILRLGRVF